MTSSLGNYLRQQWSVCKFCLKSGDLVLVGNLFCFILRNAFLKFPIFFLERQHRVQQFRMRGLLYRLYPDRFPCHVQFSPAESPNTAGERRGTLSVAVSESEVAA